MTNTNQDFETSLAAFLTDCQNKINQHFKDKYPNLTAPYLTILPGRKFIKIINNDAPGSSRSVWAFINKENGDILKPASWVAPAKHARGNIYNPETWTTVTVYGPMYLR